MPAAETGRELEGATESGRYVHLGEPLVVVAVDFHRLVDLATRAEAAIDIEVGVGDTLLNGGVVARVRGGSVPLAEIEKAFLLGTERTMEQDPKFALRLLVDVAIKALSPAVNDPTTAVQALDQIEDLLRRIGVRTLDLGRLVGVRGYTRVTYPAPTWDDLLALATDEIRMYGADSLQVVRRLRLALRRPRRRLCRPSGGPRSRTGCIASTRRSSRASRRPTARTRASPIPRGSASPAWRS